MKPFFDVSQLSNKLQKLPLNRVQSVLNLVLVVVVAWLLARFSWQLLPKPESATLPPLLASYAAMPSANAVSLNELTSHALFGKVTNEPVKAIEPVVTDAPKTRLNVKLTGLVAMAGNKGGAIIESQGSESTYIVGDSIAGTNAVLHQVLRDRVLLSQNGRFETLMLDGIEFNKIAQANEGLGREAEVAEVEPATVDLGMAPKIETFEVQPIQVTDHLVRQRDELSAQPLKFADYFRIQPSRSNGALEGYRLMPGKDPSMFTQLGLLADDLVVEINGIALTDPQRSVSAVSSLRDAKQISIKIKRDGELRDLLINL